MIVWHMLVLIFITFVTALLSAAPSDPRAEPAYLLEFTLEESPAEIVARMGPPAQAADSDVNYRVWQYQIEVADNHDFSHTFCFRKSDGKLVSVTRSFGEERNVDALFPASTRRIYHWPTAEKPQYSVLVRQVPGNRVLIAMGVSRPGQPAGQLLLIRRDAMQFFLPWLVPQLQAAQVQHRRAE